MGRSMARQSRRPPICDYEGSNYRTEFWEGKGRGYEDRAERIALRRLLPERGRRLLEIGAGFGRLTGEYNLYEQVVLLDYSLSQLQYAQEKYGRSGRFVYVAADAYHLPFRDAVFDGATMVRVIHHMAQVADVLGEIRRVLVPGAVFILEHANKRNLKAVLRYALKAQQWNPHTLEPVEFVELNFDFHPQYIANALQEAGFTIQRRIPVSYFRIPILKQIVPPQVLAGLDGLLQLTGLLYAPSVFARCVVEGRAVDLPPAQPIEQIFACPECGGPLIRQGEAMVCQQEGRRWAVRDGIYDFKAPVDDLDEPDDARSASDDEGADQRS